MAYAQDFDFNKNQLKTNRELAKAQLAALGTSSLREAFFKSGFRTLLDILPRRISLLCGECGVFRGFVASSNKQRSVGLGGAR